VIDGVFPSAEDCAFANVLLVNKFLQSLDCAHPSRVGSNSTVMITLGLTGGCVSGRVLQTSTGARSTSTASR